MAIWFGLNPRELGYTGGFFDEVPEDLPVPRG